MMNAFERERLAGVRSAAAAIQRSKDPRTKAQAILVACDHKDADELERALGTE